MVDFLVKNASLSIKYNSDTTTWCHVDARWIAGGTLEKHAEKYGVNSRSRTWRFIYELPRRDDF
jgi:hypothetical protein